MKVVQFAPESPEAIAAMRCADETVIIPGYGTVQMATVDKLDGVVNVTVTFYDQPL